MKRNSYIFMKEDLNFDYKKLLLEELKDFIDDRVRILNDKKNAFIKAKTFHVNKSELLKTIYDWITNLAVIISNTYKLKDLYDQQGWVEITINDFLPFTNR